MSLEKIVTRYSNSVGLAGMFILPLLILVLLFLAGFDQEHTLAIVATGLWILFFLNSTVLSLNGILLNRSFVKEIEKKTQQGVPVDSLEGFDEIKGSVARTLRSTVFITITVFLSLVIFLTGSLILDILQGNSSSGDSEGTNFFVIFSAIGLSLLGIGITLMLRLPDRPAFEPGAFIGHFSPSQVPCQIDNLLSDTLVPFMDPITRLRYDEWEDYLQDSLRDDFIPDENLKTRLEVAREKVLLFVYLTQRMETIITPEVARDELGEIVRKDRLDGLFEGHGSGISWQILTEIIQKVREQAPEIFEIIDRILIDLRENLANFQEDIWVTVGAPSKISGTQDPFRFLVFALNLHPRFREKKRPIRFSLASSEENPPFHYTLYLDESEDLGLEGKEELEFTAEDGPDVVGVLSRILQVGDAVWFQVYRNTFGKHVFRINLEEPGKGGIYGISLTVSVVRDLMFYIRTYGGRISALSGLALPVLGLGL